MSNKHFLGIDLHKETAYWTIKDSFNNTVYQANLVVREDETRKQAKELIKRLGNIAAVLEPVCSWQKYMSWLKEEGIEIKAVDPLQVNPVKFALRLFNGVKAIAYKRLKNDRADATILAELLRVGFAPEALPKNEEQQNILSLIKLRQFLINKRTKLKQKVREILIRENLKIDRTDIFGKKAQEELKNLNLSWHDYQVINSIISIANVINEEIKKNDNYLKEQYQAHKIITILKSIPGIGLITALTIQGVIGDWTRFKEPNNLAAYAGLVPRSYDSGSKSKKGRITKKGSKLLRAVVYEATLTGAKYSPFKEFYERIKAKKNNRLARTALTRKMLTIAWHLIKKQELFCQKQQARTSLSSLALRGCATD